MGTVIRPTFSNKSETLAEAGTPAASLLRTYGQAAGYHVSLVLDPSPLTGEVYNVVVGTLLGDELAAVAIVPKTLEGEAAASTIAMAVLCALDLVALDKSPPGGA